MKVGIIGNGFVGKSIYKTFSLMSEMYVYDKDPIKSGCTKEDIINCDVIFICVPTPMGENGECDLSYIEEVLEWVKDTHGDIVIKSTIPPGTTNQLSDKYQIDLIFSPEFLTERTAENDGITQDYVINGFAIYKNLKQISKSNIHKLYRERFGEFFSILNIPAIQAETAKYMRNSFFALKVIFANEFKDICDSLDANYNYVRRIFELSHMVAPFHLDVPGHDGKYGYGGKCFPKDVSAIIRTGEKAGVDMKLMKTVQEINDKIRI